MAIQRYNPRHVPPATLALVIINVVVSLIDMLTNGLLERYGWARGIDIQYGEYWRLFTCGWVHGDLMHIAFNAYGIYVLGSIVEQLHGWKPTLIVYLVSLMGGSCLAIAFMDPVVPLVGASGAAYGLFGALLGFFYARTGSLKSLLQIPMARMLLIWLAFGVYMSLQPGISMLGHVGGFVPGVILGMFFEHKYKREMDIYHVISVVMAGVAIVALGVFASAPVTRSSWYATRAMHAYEDGDMGLGDQLMREAKTRKHAQPGAQKLLAHVEYWRSFYDSRPNSEGIQLLNLPLTHESEVQIRGQVFGGEGREFAFLPISSEARPAE